MHGISESIVSGLFVVVAAPKVLTIGIKWSVAMMTSAIDEVWRENWEAQFVLEKGGELFWCETIVFVSAMIDSKDRAGEGAEDGREGYLDVFRGR